MAQTGRILQFDEARGYGFIAPDGGGPDVFFHVNDFDDDEELLAPGVRVVFEAMEGGRGKKAYSVRLADDRAEDEPGAASDAAPAVAPAEPAAAQSAAVGGRAAATRTASDDDGLCDVLTGEELRLELTELFLASSPELTGEQIVRLREDVQLLARKHGWVDE